MKKYIIILAIALFSIIPISNVKALTGNDNIEYPELPEDAYTENYAIFKNLSDSKIYLYTWDTENIYIASTEASSRNGLQLYFSGLFGDWDGDTNYPFNQKKYVLDNGIWSLSSSYKVGSRDYMYHGMPLFSTANIYNDGYGTQTYPSGYYYLSGTFAEEEVIYYANVIEETKEYLTFSYEKIETDNTSYYDFLFSVNDYTENYKYRIKFEDGAWHYITNEYFTYQFLYNGTIYMEVLNENGESIETKTFTILDLSTKEEFYSPTIDINVGCSTDFYTNIEQAKINLTFNNYSTFYKYQYSFNNIDYTDINYTDISNKSYTITTYINTPIYVRVLDLEGNIIYSNSSRVTCMLDSEQYYYYELSIDDLYNSETNELIYYTFLYENKKRDITPFVYFYYTGSDSLNFHISYDTEVTNFDMHYNNLANNTLEDISCTTLPFEYIDDNVFTNKYTTYTMFSFMPCIDLSTFLYGEQYTDFKLIIKSNIELNIGEPIYFGGTFLPSTNQPVDNSGYDSPFLDYFNNFVNEDFGLSAIVQAPLNFIQNLSNNTCSSLKLVMPIVNVEFELPCMSSVYSKYFGEWFTLYQTITTGVIAYWVCVKIFALVKDFHDPQNDKIEVMDL